MTRRYHFGFIGRYRSKYGHIPSYFGLQTEIDAYSVPQGLKDVHTHLLVPTKSGGSAIVVIKPDCIKV
jgi:hypothetical protein